LQDLSGETKWVVRVENGNPERTEIYAASAVCADFPPLRP
jgi:hypothetical protein